MLGVHEKEETSFEISSRFLVRWARLELAQDYSHYPLKVACLPFHHHRFCFGTANIRTNFISANFFEDFLKYLRNYWIFFQYIDCEKPRREPRTRSMPFSMNSHCTLALNPLVGS